MRTHLAGNLCPGSAPKTPSPPCAPDADQLRGAHLLSGFLIAGLRQLHPTLIICLLKFFELRILLKSPRSFPAYGFSH